MEESQDPKVRIRQERERLKLTRGKLIRRARELLGLSQEELAPKINAAANTVRL
jgi:ribosome-binding protein aMBF1 (putative translation factor)